MNGGNENSETTVPVVGEGSKKTLILEIALPDFWCDDYDFDDPEMGEILREWCQDGNLTSQALADAALEDAGLTSGRVNLSLLTGSKDGNFVERMKGQIVGNRIVPRAPEHELSDDERLDEMEGNERTQSLDDCCPSAIDGDHPCDPAPNEGGKTATCSACGRTATWPPMASENRGAGA